MTGRKSPDRTSRPGPEQGGSLTEVMRTFPWLSLDQADAESKRRAALHGLKPTPPGTEIEHADTLPFEAVAITDCTDIAWRDGDIPYAGSLDARWANPDRRKPDLLRLKVRRQGKDGAPLLEPPPVVWENDPALALFENRERLHERLQSCRTLLETPRGVIDSETRAQVEGQHAALQRAIKGES